MSKNAFYPGREWLDTEGKPIHAHGGSVLYHEGVYYWYGENKEKTGKVGYDIVDEPIRDAIRSTVSAVGEKYGLQVVDLYAFTETHPEYFGDGVHPNVPGNEAIAQHLYETLSV